MGRFEVWSIMMRKSGWQELEAVGHTVSIVRTQQKTNTSTQLLSESVSLLQFEEES